MTPRDDTFGLIFSSAYSGSMYGAGTAVHAVWPYALAHEVGGTVVLNPRLVADRLGCDPSVVVEAVAWLERADPESRDQQHAGKRLIHLGGFRYHVPGAKRFRDIGRQTFRREGDRERKRSKRSDAGGMSMDTSGISAGVRRDDLSTCSTKSFSSEKNSELLQEQEKESSKGIQTALIPMPPHQVPARLSRRKSELPPYDATFEEAWAAYGPLRSGHSKVGSWRQWLMRVAEGVDPLAMLIGAKHASAYHRHHLTPPTRIKHFETFVGPDRHFENEYVVRDDYSPSRRPSHREAGDAAAVARFEVDPTLGRLPQLPADVPYEPTW